MKKFLVFAVLSMMTQILTSCEKEVEQYYVTYLVDGSAKEFDPKRGYGCIFIVNGKNVEMPYKQTIGPVQAGYRCVLNVRISGTNTLASYTGIIKVNGKVVAKGSDHISVSGSGWQEQLTHIEYVIGE